ncbi:MAG: N-acetylmuramoyl-L-alanine amidase [Acidobacteriota bacterium]
MRWIEAGAALAMAAMAAGAQQQAPPAQPPPPPAHAAPVPPIAAPVRPPQVQPPKFLVVLDAAHGGIDIGARLEGGVAEKDVTLTLAARLRSQLRARGIDVAMIRTGDVNLAPLQRAEAANHAQAGACLTIHTTATGSGVHLFTSSLTPSEKGRFLPWETAQGAYVTQSMKLESELHAALAHTAIPVTLGRASVAPMDSMTCPEVAVEVAPLVGGAVTSGRAVTDGSYQKQVVDAVAAALEQWRSDWKVE